ncbi:MAG TPA: 50S ribosomal protein L22 [Candidatus Nanoarchaeia archaeon]|nr:50S ribosomal protein L22 [Candidatus Nanoarchaeia archaeon]
MAKYNYSIETGADCAKAVGRHLPISTKAAIEICAFIRRKPVDAAIAMLEEVKQMKRAVPYKRAFKDIGHRRGGMGPGRYPLKATAHILLIVKNARSNAENKGLNTKEMLVFHSSAQQGGVVMRGGRHGRTAKRAHVEIILKEQKKESKEKAKNPQKKEASKPAGAQ